MGVALDHGGADYERRLLRFGEGYCVLVVLALERVFAVKGSIKWSRLGRESGDQRPQVEILQIMIAAT